MAFPPPNSAGTQPGKSGDGDSELTGVSSGAVRAETRRDAPRRAEDGDSNANHDSNASFEGWYVRPFSGTACVEVIRCITIFPPCPS
jgi:hypothetical protein